MEKEEVTRKPKEESVLKVFGTTTCYQNQGHLNTRDDVRLRLSKKVKMKSTNFFEAAATDERHKHP